MKTAVRRKLFVIGIILIVVSATIYGFIPKAVDVDLAEVSRGPLQVTIEEEGRTRLKERFVLSAPTAGYMRRIGVKVGDSVQKGQIVAVLEPVRSQALDPRSRAEAEATVSAAQAGLNAAMEKERAATADADYIEKRLERMTSLYAKGSIAKDQLDQIQSEAKKARAVQGAAKAAVDVSRAELERIKKTLQDFAPNGITEKRDAMSVSSPVDGSVFRIYRESEGTVNVGEPLMDIGNVKNLEVRVDLLSSDAVKIKKGTGVLFKRWGGEGTLTGKVRVVEPAGFTKVSSLGVEEQRVLVIADMTSPPDLWRVLGDGYRLEAHFVVWEGKEILQVPASSLFRSGTKWAVFLEDNGKARQRIVEIGQRNGLTAEIISGLKEKERVVTHPDDSIGDGTPIRPRK
ncbi:MAG: HlyD family efflux transporter periplasmic adaptor subunit [Deltaproteobacteria bacterium]|nr:HlyD family efflux transporter periplasmic adaptor subunit [Deltaproteobacteria bacterium]